MIISAVASPAPISSGSWFCRPKVPLKSGISAGLVSSPRKHLHLISILHPTGKDVGCNFRVFECYFLGRASVHVVALKVETDYVVDALTQNLNNIDALASNFEDIVISYPEASSGVKTSKKERNPKRLSSSAAQIKKHDHFPVIRYPLGTESAIKATLECNTLVFVVDKHADKKNIKEAVKTMFKVRAKKVNTSLMPDGTKKAYIMLAPEFKALDVAKKIRIL